MLDYAANASVYWDAGRLRSSIESRFDSAESATEEFTDFIEGEVVADEFWDTFAANLEERRHQYAKARSSRQTFGRGKSASTTVWMGEDEDSKIANPVAGGDAGAGALILLGRGDRPDVRPARGRGSRRPGVR